MHTLFYQGSYRHFRPSWLKTRLYFFLIKAAWNFADKYNMDELETVFGNLLKDSFATDFDNDNKINVFESLFVTK